MFFGKGVELDRRDPQLLVDFPKMREGMLDATIMVAYLPQGALTPEAHAAAHAARYPVGELKAGKSLFLCKNSHICHGSAAFCYDLVLVFSAAHPVHFPGADHQPLHSLVRKQHVGAVSQHERARAQLQRPAHQ